MKNLFLLLCGVVIFSCGCSHHRTKLPNNGQGVTPLKEGRVFKPERFVKGGNLLVVPFSAGIGVAADDELDRMALLVVKGIFDVLDDGDRFKMLNAEAKDQADIVIKGRIISVLRKSTLGKPWGKKTKYLSFSVEGMVLGVENEELLARFAQDKEITGKDVSLENLAYETGIEIGHFLSGDEN